MPAVFITAIFQGISIKISRNTTSVVGTLVYYIYKKVKYLGYWLYVLLLVVLCVLLLVVLCVLLLVVLCVLLLVALRVFAELCVYCCFYFRCWTAGYKSVFGRSCDRPPRHRFFSVSMCL